MVKKRYTSKKITKVPLALFILGIIALAIPLTVIFSQQHTSFEQFAAKKKNSKNNNNNNNKHNNNNKNKKNEEAGENTHRWIPGGRTVTVEDYTNPAIWSNYVDLKVAQWSNLLHGGSNLTYVRKEFINCENLLLQKASWQLKADIIIVCSISKENNFDDYGITIWSLYPSGAIRTSLVQLVDSKAGSESNKINTVCHELGHAVGIRHNNSSESCVNSNNRKLQHPGNWDISTLKKSYGGTVSDAISEESLSIEQAD